MRIREGILVWVSFIGIVIAIYFNGPGMHAVISESGSVGFVDVPDVMAVVAVRSGRLHVTIRIRLRRGLNEWVCGCVGAWIRRCVGAWVPGCVSGCGGVV